MNSSGLLSVPISRADEAREQKDMGTARELYRRDLELDDQNEKIFYGCDWKDIG